MHQNASCKLCGNRAKLLKKSHIIPDFMYKGMHDELNRMVSAPLNVPNTKPKFQQTGYFEKYILCKKCDNEIINRWERYVDHFLFGGSLTTTTNYQHAISPEGIKSVIIDNIDYNKLKLCLLSILWRAHISQHPFFKKVDIGNTEKAIRSMLLQNDAKEEDDFKIVIVCVKNHESLIRMVVDPAVLRLGDGEISIFFINGFFYFIEIKPSTNFSLFQKTFYQKKWQL